MCKKVWNPLSGVGKTFGINRYDEHSIHTMVKNQMFEALVMQSIGPLFVSSSWIPLQSIRVSWTFSKPIVDSQACKDWPAKKVTIYFPIFYLVKRSENILFFYLHFT